jgi:hypothetical protein
MEEVYFSYRIHTMPNLNLESDCWIPQAEVVWEEQGRERRKLLVGPHDRFKILEDAETHAIEMAMTWIDAQLIEDLTP